MPDTNVASTVETLPRYRLSAEQVAQYHLDGFVLLRGFFSAEEMEPLRQACLADPKLGGNLRAVLDSTGNAQRVSGWTEMSDDLVGIFPRIARIVDGAEALLGREVYHWHSKLSMKPPHTAGRWDWHQDYPYWYKEGCLYPEMLTCMIAVDPVTIANGCVQLVRGSNQMGRVDHVDIGEANGVDPERLEQILKRHETVPVELAPGDACFFDGNTLHASGPNTSDGPRTILHCSYNTVRNDPYIREGQEHHAYKKLHKLPDSVILDGGYAGVFEHHQFNRARDNGKNSYGYRTVEV